MLCTFFSLLPTFQSPRHNYSNPLCSALFQTCKGVKRTQRRNSECNVRIPTPKTTLCSRNSRLKMGKFARLGCNLTPPALFLQDSSEEMPDSYDKDTTGQCWCQACFVTLFSLSFGATTTTPCSVSNLQGNQHSSQKDCQNSNTENPRF